jgi:hypothetical protein
VSERSSRAGSRRGLRGRALISVIVAACVVAYGVVVGLYALNDQTMRTDGCAVTPGPGEALLTISPQSVDAVRDRVTATIDVASFGPVGSGAVADEDLTLVLVGTDGPRTYRFDAGSLVSPISVDIITEGSVEAWPFDVHTADIGVALVRGEVTTDAETVPVVMCGMVHVPGWVFDGDPRADDDGLATFHLDVRRSAATIAFGIVLLALMVMLPVLGITVAITVLRGRRKVEASLTSWMAAMLFAIVPLRTFLPGSPPIGSWVDYLVVLWVVAGLVAALVVYVIAWLRWAAPGPVPSGVPVQERVDLPVVDAGEGAAGQR